MSDAQPTDAYRCGQLYAALAALERLGAPNAKATLDRPGARATASKNPRGALKDHLDRVVTYLMRAQNQRKGEASVAIFRSLPDLLPRTRELPGSLNPSQQEEFCDGWHAQVQALETAPR
ncbi:hypothetical protein [Streptomyces sp. NPDC002666]